MMWSFFLRLLFSVHTSQSTHIRHALAYIDKPIYGVRVAGACRMYVDDVAYSVPRTRVYSVKEFFSLLSFTFGWLPFVWMQSRLVGRSASAYLKWFFFCVWAASPVTHLMLLASFTSVDSIHVTKVMDVCSTRTPRQRLYCHGNLHIHWTNERWIEAQMDIDLVQRLGLGFLVTGYWWNGNYDFDQNSSEASYVEWNVATTNSKTILGAQQFKVVVDENICWVWIH